MNRMICGTFGVTVLLALTLGACDGRDEYGSMEGMHGEMEMDAMDGMQRHAHELDAMAAGMRQHIEEMQRVSAEQQHERMAEHVGHVSRMLGLMDSQMREMDMGVGMSDEQMGRMLGMSGEAHRAMMQEMNAIRADAEQLQTAPPAEVRRLMPVHLERLGNFVRMLEQSAEHMRGM